MFALIDTGFLYAIFDEADQHHERVIEVLPELSRRIMFLPDSALTEIMYLSNSRLGHDGMRQLLDYIIDNDDLPDLQLAFIDKDDLPRIHQILDQYADSKLDFVDATMVALAERLNIQTILTVDQRDFRIIRPLHCNHFDIKPS